MRERLIKLLREKACPDGRSGLLTDCKGCRYEAIPACYPERMADHLIVHGVTIGGWIPISEPPKSNGKYLTCIDARGVQIIETSYFALDLYEADDYDFSTKKGKSGFYGYDSEWGYFEQSNVTHWMPLPMPPKGE